MKESKKEFIQGIADLFEDYEEAYVPGEWEAFSRQQKTKYPFSPMWIKIAAVLLVGGAVALYQLYNYRTVGKKNEVVTTVDKKKINSAAAKEKGARVIVRNIPEQGSEVQKNLSVVKIQPELTPNSPLTDFPELIPPISAVTLLVPENKNAGNSISLVKPDQYIVKANVLPVPFQRNEKVNTVMGKPEINSDSVIKSKTMDFLVAESRNPVKHQQKKNAGSKWDFGVALAPSMSRSNMNIAGGVTTAYRLSEKFSLSSGLSLMQLESGNNAIAAPMVKASVSSLSEKQLLAIDANIRAIDIPVGIVYQISKKIYTSAGVSYFNVVSEKRSNTYGLTAQASESFSNPVTGYVSDRTVLNSVAIAEPVAETPLKGNSYLGFFNFSIGRKQHLFNKYDILIEPFIKVPIGKLSTQELNLMNSGLKFQINF